MYLHIIRHGETYGNINGDGYSETDLTPKGMEQARLLGERFKDSHIDKIYVSPLIRALKTAKEIEKYHPGTPVIVDSAIFEEGTAPGYCGIGEEKIREIFPHSEIPPIKPIGVENEEITFKRASDFIKKIKEENDFDSHIVVVAHGSLNSFLVTAALGMNLLEHFNFSHVNTGVTLVQYLYEDYSRDIHTKLKYLNDTSHLNNSKRDLL